MVQSLLGCLCCVKVRRGLNTGGGIIVRLRALFGPDVPLTKDKIGVVARSNHGLFDELVTLFVHTPLQSCLRSYDALRLV